MVWDERVYWLGFSLIGSIKTKRMQQLLAWFGTLEAAWHATEAQLRQYPIKDDQRQYLMTMRAKIDLKAELEKLQKFNVRFIALYDAEYPHLLRQIDDPPPILYVIGQLAVDKGFAMVGTRSATKYGRDVAHQFAKALAQQGVTIISGLAEGIDTASHQGALDGGGQTIAILGHGLDQVYPTQNRDLARKISQQGALISELPIGVPPIPQNFPRRNRLISGLALGLLVVEAPAGSGALLTADAALRQGRDVFAIPSSIFSDKGVGANRLIQDGAKLVMQVEDILNELNLSYENIITHQTTVQVMPESETERQILEVLSVNPIHIDEIVRITQLPITVVSSTLTLLELKGLAQMITHMQYSLTYS
ncbi:MAG: DNA-processing protein DprA [Anaerolineae bacterium]|nr:DNA-processing protein DprA [Anaerolineae bacterium]